MTRNNYFYIEQICNYLNLLANDTIFTIEGKPFMSIESYFEVTITCKNSAYCNELNLLKIILDNMIAMGDDRATSVVIR